MRHGLVCGLFLYWYPRRGVVCARVVWWVPFLLLRRVASFLSFVRRLSCLLSELVRGVCSLLGVFVRHVGAIGQVFCASSWYVFSMIMMWSDALSIFAGETVWEAVSLAR